ncbi:conjugal transfer protein [Pantoea ananatis 15320]|uniref:type II secretion system F family protein n=1 Tax=Pantoea ananas TaxID=553 RepID=UPI0004177438|nr:type II secretion system F family protein [Pantoea ananatis]PKC36298.1 conjugal transfer protein [Pantoea ananatis 15320]
MNRFDRFLYHLTFNAQDRIELYDEFRQYLLDKITADVIFDKLIANYTRRGKKPKHPMAQILRECAGNMSGGLGLADSLRDWLPDQEVSIIDSCNLAGKAADGFMSAADIASGTGRMGKSLKVTFMATAWVIMLLLGVLSVFCIMLVPAVIQVVPLSQWNGMQTGVYYLYLLLTDYGLPVLVIAAAVVWYIWRSLHRLTGRVRFFLDRFPPWSVYRRMQGASFILNMNAMLSAGIPMEQAVRSMNDATRSAWLKERLDALEKALSGGETNLGQALDVCGYDFPDERAIIKMQTLFETGNKEGSLKRFADLWLNRTVEDVERTGERIRLWSLVIGGILISALILIMFTLIQQSVIRN